MKHSFHLFTVFALVPFALMASAEGSSLTNALPDSVPVAITIDDLGTTGSEAVERTAKALREAGVADAYGFVIGSRVHDDRDNEESVRIWLRYGYQIGNHTFTHEGYDDVTTEFFEQDILANEPVLKEFAWAGNDWHWFRYPHLSEGDTSEKRRAVRQFLKSMPDGQNYRIAQVTVDFADWLFDTAYGRCLKQGRTDRVQWLKRIYLEKARGAFVEAQQISQRLFGRRIPQIFLVHYGRFTAEVMPELLKTLTASGARFISLREAHADPAFELDPGIALPSGENFLTSHVLARFISLREAHSDPVFELDPGIALPSGENFLTSHVLARFPPAGSDAGTVHVSTWKARVKGACPEITVRPDL